MGSLEGPPRGFLIREPNSNESHFGRTWLCVVLPVRPIRLIQRWKWNCLGGRATGLLSTLAPDYNAPSE